jgi:hypothetical protein
MYIAFLLKNISNRRISHKLFIYVVSGCQRRSQEFFQGVAPIGLNTLAG